ncbi:ABC transporter substrate-binding protein [Breoghania sp. L-A4]|uniref:ABC transporter substrate-binding protein n=1 Tax=Breoghania sp. L-A4 TaxID=2304600 RepID=UPI000E360AD3|nr:ABC transporter substrate-binding protein [Breoghania sp. L-A4]AXS42647.1 ABC transporter substrate-binding protein [Breoghania sp. L-A4]
MRKLFIACAAATALVTPLATPAFAQTVTVAVTAIVEHPALDACRDGVKDALEAAGYKTGENLNFVYESAQGNPATATQIARKFVGDRPDVIVPISTPSAQAVASATRDIPIVFSAVTDPVGAQLVESMDKPGANVTGISDFSPIAEQLALIKEIRPDVKTLGVIYNAGEANSVSTVAALKKLGAEAGIEIVESTATKTSEVQQATRALVGKADALYVPTDNTIVSAFEAAVKVAVENKLPLYAADTDSVERGALAAIGFNYYDVGKQTGEVVVAILKGTAPADIPVTVAKGTNLMVNVKTAAAIGLNIPATVLDRASKVVE